MSNTVPRGQEGPPLDSIPLKDGSETFDPRADLLLEPDQRNADYPISAMLPRADRPRLRSYTWRALTVLDQRWSGSCVGFSWAHELIARPYEVDDIDETFARERLYYEAQKRDRWPGGEYPGASPLMGGTSILACAKVVKDLGYIREYRWANSVLELASAIGFVGPAVIGCTLYKQMREPDESGFIRPDGSWLGRHAFLASGVQIRPTGGGPHDPDLSSFLLLNSWGSDWGRSGYCRITFSAMERLWREELEACVPISRSLVPQRAP